eukprot:m.249161 g.249161  ORF g.249161 m.249161 type:complete len:213 (+) comp40300_c0_seq5:297-935(+)
MACLIRRLAPAAGILRGPRVLIMSCLSSNSLEGSVAKKKRHIHEHDIHRSPNPFPPTPQAMQTNLIDFLQRTDMDRRRSFISIPEFCAGTYMAVTCSDPYARNGEIRFVGICLERRNKRLGSSFILRNVIDGEGLEKTFYLYSPTIRKIEVLKLQRRRRAKLNYLRECHPRMSTVSENMQEVGIGLDDNGSPPLFRRGKGLRQTKTKPTKRR